MITLEEHIMQAWSTSEDIDILIEILGDQELDEDTLMNALIGIKTLHDMRCTKLFNEFENIVERG